MENIAEHKRSELTVADLDAISDIYVWDTDDVEDAVARGWVHFGRAESYPIEDSPFAAWVVDLLLEIQKEHSAASGEHQFMIERDGALFRGSRHTTVTEPLISLRRGAVTVPYLEDLLLPTWWQEVLLQKDWTRNGGLVLMAAQTGCGKSTTIAAMIASRLRKYGGHCREVSDPCEFPLHGQWGNGHCIQRDVDKSLPEEKQFAEPMRDFLRAYPASSNGGRIMVVGEVRDGSAAAELVRGACAGMLVISTIHADSEASAVKRLCTMAQKEIGTFELACDLVGSSLRCVMNQYLEPNPRPDAKGWHRYKVCGDMLISDGAQHSVGANILEGKFHLLNQQMDRQRKLFAASNPRQRTLDDLMEEMRRG